MWNPLQSLQGLMSRKQENLFEKLKAKAAAEGKTAYGKMEELADAYVNSLPTSAVGNTSNQTRGQLQGPAANSPAAQLQVGTLQYELEKTKATLQAAFDLSDMLRPEAAEPTTAPEDKMLQTLLTTWIQNQTAAKTGGVADMPLAR